MQQIADGTQDFTQIVRKITKHSEDEKQTTGKKHFEEVPNSNNAWYAWTHSVLLDKEGE